jgi:hypothetical protein
MPRLDDPTIYNPYCWRLAELTDRTPDDDRRRRLLDELVVWEATELAHGYRHVTIVHGDPNDLAPSRRLSAFYNTLRLLTGRLDWVRVRGSADYVTVTVRGPHADERIAELAAAAAQADPGGWEITPTAFPPSATG